MIDGNYKKKYEFQKDIISRQQKQIADLKSKVAELESKCKEKDEIINSVESLRIELTSHINDAKSKKEQY